MTPAQFIEKRKKDWLELEELLNTFENKADIFIQAKTYLRFARLYRAVCTDSSLGQAYRLSKQSQSYLQNLVARSHSILYSYPGNKVKHLLMFFTHTIPQSVFKDKYVWICQFTFFTTLIASSIVSYQSLEFTQSVVGEEMMNKVEKMHTSDHTIQASKMIAASSWYVWNNASIDLQIFSLGILGGIGSLLAIIFNGINLGAVFGFLLSGPAHSNILCWICGHAPFELFAIGLSGGAGLRIGYSFIAAQGRSRMRSLKEESIESIPIITAAVSLTIIAAFIEAFLAPQACDVFPSNVWTLKLTTMTCSILFIITYFYGLGFIRSQQLQGKNEN